MKDKTEFASFGIRRIMVVGMLLIQAMLLAACSSGGSADDPSRVSRIEVTPGTALITGLGESYSLKATAYDAEGNVLNVNFDWTSSNPNLMTVDGRGKVTSRDYVGSSLISARAGEVSGEATLLAVELMPNSVLVSDAQVLDIPLLQDPDTPPDVGSLYEVTLDESVAVTVGDILLASESAPIGGRVVDVVVSGAGQVVTLELIPLNQMFSRLKINETYRLTNDDAEIPQVVSDAYDISENPDGSLTFTPKTPGAEKSGSPPANLQAFGIPVGTVADPESLIKCKSELTPQTSPLPLTLNALPVSNGLSIDLDLIVDYDSAGNGLEKLALAGQAKLEMKVTPTLEIAAEGKISCEMELVTLTIPIGGPVAVVLGGQVPIGLGFEIGGKLTLAQIGAEVQTKAQLDAVIGVQYNQTLGEWEMVNSSNSSADADYKLVLPDSANLDAQFRLEPAIKGFVFADLALGNRFIESLRFETFKMSAGPVESAKLSTVNGQVADTGFASEYKMSLNFNGKLGAEAEALFNFLNINVAAFDLFNIDLELFKSPLMTSARASVGSFGVGDTVDFTVELNRDSLQYFSLTSLEPYNIDDIIIYRKIDNGGIITTQEVARTTASLGQSRFELSWVADSAGSIESDFYVFVDTRALEIPLTFGAGIPYLDELELGTVSVAGSNQLAFSSNRVNGVYDYDVYRVDGDGTGLVRLYDEPGQSGIIPLSWSPDGSRLVFSHGGIQSVMDSDGLNRTDLANSAPGGGAAWSPDGSRICYLTFDGGAYDLTIVGADGVSNPVRITNNDPPGSGAYRLSTFNWRPDGSGIVFDNLIGSASDIFTVNSNGSGLVNLTSTVAGQAVNPLVSYDGSKIAYRYRESNVTDLYVMNSDGSSKTNITNLNTTTYLRDYAWSPNGLLMVYATSANVLSLYNAQNGSYQTLLANAAYTDFATPVWSPNGSTIAFRVYSSDPAGNTGIFTINSDGSGLNRLTSSNDFSPVWSPGGSRIAFTRAQGGSDYDIIVINADGTNPIDVSDSDGADQRPAWRP